MTEAPGVQWEHDGGGETSDSDWKPTWGGFPEEMTLGLSSEN